MTRISSHKLNIARWNSQNAYKTAQRNFTRFQKFEKAKEDEVVMILDLWRTLCPVCKEITAFFWISKLGVNYYECKECKSTKPYFTHGTV